MGLNCLDELIKRDKSTMVIIESLFLGEGFKYTITKCPVCGKHLYSKDNFCKHCGQRLEWGNNND